MIPRYTREEMGHIWSGTQRVRHNVIGRNIGIRGTN